MYDKLWRVLKQPYSGCGAPVEFPTKMPVSDSMPVSGSVEGSTRIVPKMIELGRRPQQLMCAHPSLHKDLNLCPGFAISSKG